MGTALWQMKSGFSFTMRALVFLLCFTSTVAQFANPTYFMDSTADCYKGGYLLIKEDAVVEIYSHKTGTSASNIRECTLRFRPEDTRSIIDVQFTKLTISDRDVTLRVNLDGGGTYTLSSGSRLPGQLTSEGGMATITLRRLSDGSPAYSFAITIRVYKKDLGLPTVDDSRGAVGLVVGLIVGIIVFLVFIAVVGVCCYRRKKEQYLARTPGRNYKGELANDGILPSDSYGLDNAAQQGRFTPQRDQDAYSDYANNSPRLKQKLLTSTVNDFSYRDRSGSESDSKDSYIPKSYGKSDFNKDDYIIRNYNQSPSKTTSVRYEDENPGREPQRNYSQERFDLRENNSRGRNSDQKQSQPPRSPNLNRQYSDPRFRPQEELPRRGDGRRGDYSDSNSDSDTPKKRTNTSISRDPQPPEKVVPKPRSLPVVSKSPKPSPQSEKDSRNVRPPSASQSSSETEESVGRKSGIDMSLGEDTSPLPVSREKPDTRHVLRPDRSKGKKTPEKKTASPEPVRQESVNSTDSQLPKPAKQKSKPAKSKKSGKTESKQDAPEYEGRFKKAESARKGKSKTPRMGRSRSAGNAFDDTDSIGGGSVSSAGGYRAVPSVTADDYEDSDMESNYHPLRKTGSKSSLYASRSSLYGRRRRKNSIGDSVYSSAYDYPDSFDREGFKERSLSRRHRGFRSVGDLEMELREQKAVSTQTLRETASQTARRKNSVSSTSGRSKSRDRGNSVSSSAGRPKRAKSESELRRKVREAKEEEEERGRPRTPKEKPALKPKPRPKPKPRKSTTTSMDDDRDSVITGTTATFGPSSSDGVPLAKPVHPVMPMYPPQGYPVYVAGYQPQMPVVHAEPYGAVPGVVVNPGAASNPALSKWDMLCQITDARETENESVA